MTRTSVYERASGVLLHATSLSDIDGTGQLGRPANEFVEFLARARQRWWQMLPLGPPGAGGSPYDSTSSFAGRMDLISLDGLVTDGLLSKTDLHDAPQDRLARRSPARRLRYRLAKLKKAFERSRASDPAARRTRRSVERFRETSRKWLQDYALFAALREAHAGAPWYEWAPDLRDRRRAALANARNELASEIAFHEFLQYCFDRDFVYLQRHCRRRGIGLLGDLPLFVSQDSADVWAHRELFKLDRTGRPTVVVGAPPDDFSRTGQLWGNPAYDWTAHRRTRFAWWIERLRASLDRFDAVRLDHFIGFHRCWLVHPRARSARVGRFERSPGVEILERLRRRLRRQRLPLVAEDLGSVTPRVHALRDAFELPGMHVLQFGFGSGAGAALHRIAGVRRNALVYTGTHDTNTAVGWFRSLPRGQRRRVLAYFGGDERSVHSSMIRTAATSAANLAIVPMQDWLGLDARARMNVPGTTTGNWRWQLGSRDTTDELAFEMAELACATSRAGD